MPWIIKEMPLPTRDEKMTLRLTTEEIRLRNLLAEHYGVSGADVMRMGLRRLAKVAGVEPSADKKRSRRP
jgi:hypothetical protein